MTEWLEGKDHFSGKKKKMCLRRLLSGIGEGRRGQGKHKCYLKQAVTLWGRLGHLLRLQSHYNQKTNISPDRMYESRISKRVGKRGIQAFAFPTARLHLRSLLLVGAYWKGNTNSLNWVSGLTSLTWLSVTMRDGPLRTTRSPHSDDSGNRREILDTN